MAPRLLRFCREWLIAAIEDWKGKNSSNALICMLAAEGKKAVSLEQCLPPLLVCRAAVIKEVTQQVGAEAPGVKRWQSRSRQSNMRGTRKVFLPEFNSGSHTSAPPDSTHNAVTTKAFARHWTPIWTQIVRFSKSSVQVLESFILVVLHVFKFSDGLQCTTEKLLCSTRTQCHETCWLAGFNSFDLKSTLKMCQQNKCEVFNWFI